VSTITFSFLSGAISWFSVYTLSWSLWPREPCYCFCYHAHFVMGLGLSPELSQLKIKIKCGRVFPFYFIMWWIWCWCLISYSGGWKLSDSVWIEVPLFSHFLFFWGFHILFFFVGGIFIFSWSPKLADLNDKLLDCFRQESLINMGFSFYHELHSLKIKIKCSHGIFSIFKWDESSVDAYYMIEGVGNPVMMFVLMCLFSHFLLFLKNILFCWGFSHSIGYLS